VGSTRVGLADKRGVTVQQEVISRVVASDAAPGPAQAIDC